MLRKTSKAPLWVLAFKKRQQALWQKLCNSMKADGDIGDRWVRMSVEMEIKPRLAKLVDAKCTKPGVVLVFETLNGHICQQFFGFRQIRVRTPFEPECELDMIHGQLSLTGAECKLKWVGRGLGAGGDVISGHDVESFLRQFKQAMLATYDLL